MEQIEKEMHVWRCEERNDIIRGRPVRSVIIARDASEASLARVLLDSKGQVCGFWGQFSETPESVKGWDARRQDDWFRANAWSFDQSCSIVWEFVGKYVDGDALHRVQLQTDRDGVQRGEIRYGDIVVELTKNHSRSIGDEPLPVRVTVIIRRGW